MLKSMMKTMIKKIERRFVFRKEKQLMNEKNLDVNIIMRRFRQNVMNSDEILNLEVK